MTGAAAALLAAWPPGNASAATPVEPRTALEVDRMDAPTVAALPDGRALVGWTNGNNNGDAANVVVRPAGGVLGPNYQPLRRGRAPRQLGFLHGGPAANPVLTWFDDDERRPFLSRLDGDQLTTPSGVFSPGSQFEGQDVSYARCPDRSTVLGFQFTHNGNTSRTSYSAYAGLGDENGKLADPLPKVFSTSLDQGQKPTVTCDRNISPIVAYVNDHDGVDTKYGDQITVRNVRIEDEVLMTRNLPPGTEAYGVDARIAPDGRLWIIWQETLGKTRKTYVATRAPGKAGPVGQATVLDASGYAETLFFGAGGRSHVLVYERRADERVRIGVRTAAPGADTFGTAEWLVDYDLQLASVLTDHPDGLPRLLIRRLADAKSGTSAFAVQGIIAAGTTDAYTPLNFSLRGGSASASYLPSGDLFIAGGARIETDRVLLREGGLDTGAPPTVDPIAVPGEAPVGQPVTLSAIASDPLGLASFTWTVDGKTYTDQQVSHTFVAPGTYVATARAVDRAGIATVVSRTIRVTDPVAPTGENTGGAVADRTAPQLSAVSATRGRRGASARTVTLKLTPNEAVAVDLELLGRAKGAKGKRARSVVLRSGRVAKVTAGKPATAKLKLPTKLPRTVGATFTVRITATDLAGNRTVRTVAVKRAKR